MVTVDFYFLTADSSSFLGRVGSVDILKLQQPTISSLLSSAMSVECPQTRFAR